MKEGKTSTYVTKHFKLLYKKKLHNTSKIHSKKGTMFAINVAQ